MVLTHAGHLWLCIWKCMCPRNSEAVRFKNRRPFWWESLLSLFKRDSSIHISCLQRLSLWGWCMITVFRCPSWQNSNKNNTLIVFHAKAGLAALEMMSSQFQPYVRWTLCGSDCLLFWFLVSLEETGATSQGLLTPLPPLKAKTWFCQFSRPQDCWLVLLGF